MEQLIYHNKRIDMKKAILLTALMLGLISCASQTREQGRSISSDPCADNYFVDENTHFDHFETCHGF